MDLAYDHITEQSLPKDGENKETEGSGSGGPTSTLNADLQAAYSALSANPWASRIGGFFGNVVKQGESVYREAQQEVTALGQDATKGLTELRTNLVNRTRGLSISTRGPFTAPAGGEATTASTDRSVTPTAGTAAGAGAGAGAAGDDDTNVLALLKGEAAKRLRDLQRAEDAADEALLKFGTNVRDFLREAISIAPPAEGGATGSAAGTGAAGGGGGAAGGLLFESKDAQGRRVIHTSRFDAQLHVIHSNTDSFARDPTASDEFSTWAASFDIAAQTDNIAGDLTKYPELRATMEKLVPDVIPYADFWTRYYFLRNSIETAEARRRDLLQAVSTTEEIGWDEDSEEEEDKGKGKEGEKVKAKGKKETKEKETKEKETEEKETKVEKGEKKVEEKTVDEKKAEQEEEEEDEEEDDEDDESSEEESSDEEEDSGDDDDDDEQKKTGTATAAGRTAQRRGSTESSMTIHPPPAKTKATPAATGTSATATAPTATAKAKAAPSAMLKAPLAPRKSDEKSQADSDASYDIVGAKSGAPSQAPNSPREAHKADEDSEEEDWE